MRTVILFALKLRTAIVDWFVERRERAERKRRLDEMNERCLKEYHRQVRLWHRRIERQRQRQLAAGDTTPIRPEDFRKPTLICCIVNEQVLPPQVCGS